MNSTNSSSSRNGSVAPRAPASTSSSSGGAVPKVKSRKKLSSHPNTYSPPHPQFPHQIDPQTMHQQFMSLTQQQVATNSPFQNLSNNNSSQTIVNGLPPSAGCKNTPKNQLIFDWQTGEIPQYTTRNCRNRQPSSDLYDSASDESVSQDNRNIVHGNSFRSILSEISSSADPQTTYHHYHRLRMNGQDIGTGATPSLSPSEVSSHSLALNNGATPDHPNRNSESKKNNVPSSPDRAHVEHRLSQIQDYIKQTSSLIESYKLSGAGATDDSNSEFLIGVLKDLHDSEAKLKCLLSAYDQIILEDDGKNSVEASATEAASRVPQPQEPQVNGNDHSVNANGSAKVTDTRKQMEIKMKFEESLRQLHALQAEQAILIQKKSEAQEQLQEAQRARNILIAMSSNGCAVNTQGAGCSGSEDQSTDTLANNLQDVDRRLPSLRGKCQTLPNREFPAKKRQSADFQSDVTTYLKELLTGDEVKEQASSEDSAVEDAIDEYAEARAQVRLQGQIVQDKVAEINALRAQLDQAKSLLNIAHRRDGRPQVSDNSVADEGVDHQVVNILQEQKGDEDSLDSRANKPSVKQQQLEHERAKLGRLRGLLATVQEYRSSGLPIPEHILNEFGNETQPDTTHEAQEAVQDEDAAVEADVEEDDEPESATQWNQQHLSLIESASMASELSHGLQQRAAQLQVERDGLAAMQRQLDGLFNQLQQHPTAKSPEATRAATPVNTSQSNSSPLHRPRSSHETKRADEAVQRRMEILSDLHSRWQQLQDDIASDGELSIKAAPVLNATKTALNKLTHQILPENIVADDNTAELAWDLGSPAGRGRSTPARNERTPQPHSHEFQFHDGNQMSSAPSTLMRRRSPSGVACRNQRAVWSAANEEEASASLDNSSSILRYRSLPSEENPPIISMPSPSPSVLQQQQQTQEMKDRIAALSRSCQSLCLDSVEGMNASTALPVMPAVAIPPPPPPPAGSLSHDREAYYQQLLAAGQLQQQQVLLTAINQCFHILKLQQHELLNLSNSVHMLSSGAGHVPPVGVHSSVLSGVHASVNGGVNVHQGVHQGVHPGVHHAMLQSEEPWATPSPAPGPGPPTLNNQVPPGNRTNNYWDNFRSYSRQNLLSTSAKSNEGLPHSPSPLVERSHNSLRSSTPMSVPGQSSMSVASSMPQYHTLSTPSCLSGAGSALPQTQSLAEQGSAPLGAVGPIPPATLDFSHTSLAQNISRKDKRNIDYTEGILASPRRRPSNEIDHRTAARVLEDAALPLNSQLISPASQEFEVPAMPILRNSVSGLQSRLSQVNLNAPPSFTNLHDFMDTQNTRQQLNNEGVPFSEISTSLPNHQFNEFHGPCSLENAREGSRRLNMDFHNGTTDSEPTSSTVLKRNTGAIKRTYTSSQSSTSNSSSLNPNIQRNIHTSPAVSQLSSSNASCNSDSEALFKSSKLQLGQDCTRNYNSVGKRPGISEEFQVPCSSSISSRTRMRGINETDDHSLFQHDHSEDTEYEDAPLLRSVGFNNCQSSTSSQSSTSQNTSNVELHSHGPGKNHLKESCFQIRKCPKYQTKSGSRSPLSDTTAVAAAAVAVAAVSQNSPSHRNVRSSSGKSQLSNSQRSVNKNNKEDYTIPNQMSGQGQLYEELRESVYSEMTSLISDNGSRSHFLVQLLRDLQHVSSDSVRQSVIQLIQQAVSRYQIDLSAAGHDGYCLDVEDEAEEDEDEAKRMESQRLERDRLPYAGACSSSELKGPSSSTQEGETLMQLVLGLELAAVLSGNADENCSSNLIEDVRNRIFQLIPMNQPTSTQAVNSPRSISYVHSQIDNVLDSVFLKFQGCRIGDVRNEITSCVVSALPIKLMYRSMVEYYSRNNMESESLVRRDSSVSFRESSSSPSVSTVSPSCLQYPQHSSSLGHQDGRDLGVLQEASNGDLAEADQSHHSINAVDEDGDSEADRDCSTDGPLSASVSESASGLLHVHVYQLSGVSEAIDSEPEVEALQEEGEVITCTLIDRNVGRNDTLGAVGGAIVSDGERNNVDNISESWNIENNQSNDSDQERVREQGLDQVPTRLACDNDRDQENGEKHRSHHLAMPPHDHSS